MKSAFEGHLHCPKSSEIKDAYFHMDTSHVATETFQTASEATEHAQIGLEQRKQALRPIFVDLPARVFLLGMVDERVDVASHPPVTTGRVRVEPTARLYRDVRRLL